MLDWFAPATFAAFVWWASTGVVLVLVRLKAPRMQQTMLCASIVAVAALFALVSSSQGTTVGEAYVAFLCAVVVWGWHELAFLCGWLTGPRRAACSQGCRGWPHFLHAIEAILWHELAIAATAALIVALTWDAPNPTGTFTFLVLWAMRVSAKLNLFFGVRNLGLEFLPRRMRYLTSFFRRRPMNMLFPFSVTLPTAVAALVIEAALAPGVPESRATGLALVATLLALAILEHWMMVLPMPLTPLWKWAIETGRRRSGSARVARAAAVRGGPVAPLSVRAPPLEIAALPAGKLERRTAVVPLEPIP
jgi:putative photosynthetic complex assembly protein 2